MSTSGQREDQLSIEAQKFWSIETRVRSISCLLLCITLHLCVTGCNRSKSMWRLSKSEPFVSSPSPDKFSETTRSIFSLASFGMPTVVPVDTDTSKADSSSQPPSLVQREEIPLVPNCGFSETGEPQGTPVEAIDGLWFATLPHVEILAIRLNRVLRSDATFLQPGNPLLQGPDGVPTTYDPMIVNSGFLFGQRGVQAALSDFDTRFNARISHGSNELVQNNQFLSGGILPGGTLDDRTGDFTTSLRKFLPRGGSIAAIHDWNYDASNRQDVFYPSVYTGNIRAEFRQPMLAGFGKQYNSVAGPLGDSIEGVTGVNQGVLIAKLQSEESVIDLELATGRLIRDIQSLYWQLGAAHAAVEFTKRAEQELLSIEENVNASISENAFGGLLDLSEVKDAILSTKQQQLAAERQSQDYQSRLKRIVGFSSADPTIIFPQELVIDVPFVVDVEEARIQGVEFRPEPRKMTLQSISLSNQVRAAKNLMLPRLDGTASQRANGFGDRLTGTPSVGPDQDIQVAYDNLFQGDNTGWQVGLELNQTLGRRLAHSRLRNLQLQLARLGAIQGEQRREIEYEITVAADELSRTNQTLAVARNRRQLAWERCEILANQISAGGHNELATRLAEAISRRAEADLNYFTALGQYHAAKVEFDFRRGVTLRNSSVSVAMPTNDS
jgi:hypothetical protein